MARPKRLLFGNLVRRTRKHADSESVSRRVDLENEVRNACLISSLQSTGERALPIQGRQLRRAKRDPERRFLYICWAVLILAWVSAHLLGWYLAGK